jgi:release factor glutamine methyltransferase
MTYMTSSGVFHPRYFYSTLFVLDHLKTVALSRVRVLEVGCGCGMLSVYCARQGAEVTALDINPLAISDTETNAHINQVAVRTILSDLFSNLPKEGWDLLLINPPFFAAVPKNMADFAWRCGTHHEYLHHFFEQFRTVTHSQSQVVMVLSDICDLKRILKIAEEYNVTMKVIKEKKTHGEKLYLYSVK